MDLPDIGEVVTPVDDPCQYHPAWRSVVSNYLVSAGVRGMGDLDSISRTGGIEVPVRAANAEKKRTPKRGGRRKGEERKVSLRRVPPFDRSPEYRPFASDRWICMLVSLMVSGGSGAPTPDELVPVKLATRYYEEAEHEAAIRKRIEPLLLTDADMDVIALDLVGLASARPVFEAYEKLYFNCRQDDFSLNPSMQLIQRLAMPWGPLRTWMKKGESLDEDGFIVGDGRPLAKDSDVWKAVGATMGYEALMYVWRWNSRAHGMKDDSMEHMLGLAWKAAVSQLIAKLYTGDVSHEDAARLLSSFTAQSKRISDERSGAAAGGPGDTTKVLMDILYLAAPKMVRFSDAEDAARNDEIQSRIASQLAINKQSVEDRGKQVEAEIVDAQISAAVSQ